MNTIDTTLRTTQQKVLKSHVFKGSRKDLVNTVIHLRTQLKSLKIDQAIEHFQTMIKKQIYIGYKKHLGGVCHHTNVGPARRPIKTYKYIVEVLKNFRSEFEKLSTYNVSRVILHYTNAYRLGGHIIKSKGRSFLKDSRRFYLKFFINYQ